MHPINLFRSKRENSHRNDLIFQSIYIYIYAFSRRFYPKRLTVHSGYTCFISMCVPWESNPQPFALLTQCSTTEPQEHLEAVHLFCLHTEKNSHIFRVTWPAFQIELLISVVWVQGRYVNASLNYILTYFCRRVKQQREPDQNIWICWFELVLRSESRWWNGKPTFLPQRSQR